MNDARTSMSTFTRTAVTGTAALTAAAVVWQVALYNVRTGHTDWFGAACLSGVAAVVAGWAFWAVTGSRFTAGQIGRWSAPLWCGAVGAGFFAMHPLAGWLGLIYGVAVGVLVVLVGTPVWDEEPDGADSVWPGDFYGNDDEQATARYTPPPVIGPYADQR